MMLPTVAGQYGSEPSQPLAGNITRPSTTIEGQAHPPSSKAQPRAARGSRLVARACSATARFLQAEQAQHVLTRCLLGTPELRNESRAVNPLPCGRAWVPPGSPPPPPPRASSKQSAECQASLDSPPPQPASDKGPADSTNDPQPSTQVLAVPRSPEAWAWGSPSLEPVCTPPPAPAALHPAPRWGPLHVATVLIIHSWAAHAQNARSPQ